jgi:DNA polymerase-3 subunit gamma/tau
LARYLRNLLVKKIAPDKKHLIAASPAEQARLAEVSAWFSEEDLTRYLQITLDLFKDLQNALQPRLHMELGLLRLIHAGRLMPIEEALATLQGGGSAPASRPPAASTPSPAATRSFAPQASATQASATQASATQATAPSGAPQSAPPLRTAPAPPPARKVAPAAAEVDWRAILYAGLHELKLPHTADAIEASEIVEQNGVLMITAPNRLHEISLKSDLGPAIEKITGRAMKLQIKVGQVATSANSAALAKPEAAVGGSGNAAAAQSGNATEDAARERALAHPGVQKFQEMFPEGVIRQVRNLKE